LGIDLASVDYAIASHAHGDHINGFDYLLEVNPQVKIYLPFDFFTGAKVNLNVAGQERNIADSLPVEIQTVAIQLKDVLGVQRIAPAHCTGHLAFKLLKDAYGDDYVFAGLGETITL